MKRAAVLCCLCLTLLLLAPSAMADVLFTMTDLTNPADSFSFTLGPTPTSSDSYWIQYNGVLINGSPYDVEINLPTYGNAGVYISTHLGGSLVGQSVGSTLYTLDNQGNIVFTIGTFDLTNNGWAGYGSGPTYTDNYQLTTSVVPAPEPATLSLVGVGSLALIRKLRKKFASA